MAIKVKIVEDDGTEDKLVGTAGILAMVVRTPETKHLEVDDAFSRVMGTFNGAELLLMTQLIAEYVEEIMRQNFKFHDFDIVQHLSEAMKRPSTEILEKLPVDTSVAN